MKPLDIHTFPLQGQSLIEASAGTGKTYTINQLYRRLILGHGDAPKRLSCTDVLVVTFTKAATEELRGRIRSGLREAYEALLSVDHAGSFADITDPDIRRWVSELYFDALAALDEQEDQQAYLLQLRTWLQVNLAQMDESSIYTIHRFCAQILKRFAFDSGVAFNVAMETEGEVYLRRACEDVWRRECYPSSAEQLAAITQHWSSPESVFHYFRSWVAKSNLTIRPEIKEDYLTLWQKFHACRNEIKTLWFLLSSEGLDKAIFDADIDKRSYSQKHYPNWKQQIGDYLLTGVLLPLPVNLPRFGAALLHEKTKKGEPPKHLLFEKIDALIALEQQLSMALELKWFNAVYQRYLELLEQAAVMTSDDLLRLLDDALQSERGSELAAQIRALYPVAMIDEFQDTDSIQYRIFNTLYPPTDVKAHSASEHSSSEHSSSEPLGYGLIMIGDPKQAIYAFRGADIFTYMSARDQIPDDRCFTLDTNYRSHPTLVSATNALWKMHPHPFVFKDHIAFHPVNAGKAADDSAPIWPSADLSSALSSPLQIWYDEAFSDESPDDAYARIADECAEQIEAVLSGAAVFPATTAKAQSQKKSNKTQDGKPLLAGDMAVLVYSRKQAAWIRNALTARNIGSVFLTRDSVFQTQQASDLLVLLEAVEQPANESMVRRALATPTWGGNASDLALMHIDEVLWEQQLNHLQRYQHTWQRRGIMAMLMQWLDDDQRAVRLRSEPDGERILTNLLHLGEMLQGHSRKVRGHQALIRWLQEHISDEQLAQEEAQLRLETDDKLVTIVTIHKSKGLEYPLVFLPYLWADKAERFAQDKEVIYYDGQRVIRDLSASDDSKALQNRDILAEKMRLLYVALTRAKYGCFLWISNAGSGKKKTPLWLQSALGYLLSKQSDGSEVSLATLSIPDVYVGPRPSWQNHNQARLDFAPEPVSANVFSSSRYGQLRDHWRVGSYSQLAMHGQHQFEQGDAGAQVVDWEVAGERESSRGALTTETTDDMPQLRPLALRFPKGANPGTCLHAIFEDWDFVDTEQLRTIVHMRLTLHGINGVEVEEVVAWFQSMVHQPLPLFVAGENSNTKPSIQLRDLTKASRLDEMEFYLPVGHLTAGDVESLLGNLNQADYEQDNIGASARFQFEPLTGYLKGFIDLIFEWQGRYYVLDYKSNYLGERAEDYYPDALRQSMVEHKYDLQSWIYMVALDRLLAQRLPNYDPQQHLGGSVYMYLRGIALHSAGDGFENHTDNTSESPACGVCFTPLDVDALQHWRNALLGESYVAQISEQDKNDRKDKKAIINKKEKGADA